MKCDTSDSGILFLFEQSSNIKHSFDYIACLGTMLQVLNGYVISCPGQNRRQDLMMPLREISSRQTAWNYRPQIAVHDYFKIILASATEQPSFEQKSGFMSMDSKRSTSSMLSRESFRTVSINAWRFTGGAPR